MADLASDELIEEAADVNQDGESNVADINAIRRIMAGLE